MVSATPVFGPQGWCLHRGSPSQAIARGMAWGLALLLALVVLVGPGARAEAAIAPQEASANGGATPMVETTPPAQSAQPDASTVPSETVSRFVNAYLAVVKLIESREQSLQSAETETESRQMQQEIQAEAVNLIQTNGLTLQAYWELLGLANSDPEFRERVLAQIEEANP